MCVPLKRTVIQKRTENEYLWLEILPLEEECTNVVEGLTLEGEIVRNPSVSLSFILARNEKIEHYIRIKTHKPIVLEF